jgi:hypothetical protein
MDTDLHRYWQDRATASDVSSETAATPRLTATRGWRAARKQLLQLVLATAILCSGASALAQTGGIVLEEVVTGESLESAFVTTSTDVTAVSDDLYLAAVSSKRFDLTIAVNGLGLLWTPVVEQCSGDDDSGNSSTGAAIWMARGVPAGSGPVSAQLASKSRSAVITVVRYSGTHTVDPIGAIASANTNGPQGACSGGVDSDTYSVDIAATEDGAVIFGAVGIRQREHTPGADYVEIAEVHSGTLGARSGQATEHRTLTTGGTVPVDGSLSNTTDWAVAALEIIPASEAGTCGDAVCSGAETCVSCPDDCDPCADCIDVDGDDFGEFGSPSCLNPGADCNDAISTIYPGAPEALCDSIDNDCDGLADDDVNADGDPVSTCEGDCDDANPDIFPGAAEAICDSIDNNCNGIGDDDVNADGDPVSTCQGDCDDANPDVFPGNAEITCDGIDNNCNGIGDDDVNADGDPVSACSGDCDDADPDIFPGNAETLCDGIDNNCNGIGDDDVNADGDPVSVCSGDCNDDDPTIYPGNLEVCTDQVDNDCNVAVDCADATCSEGPACVPQAVPALPGAWGAVLGLAMIGVVAWQTRRRA